MVTSNRKNVDSRSKTAIKMINIGVKEFNEWRKKNKNIILDLNDAKFSGDLSYINLSKTHLKNAVFDDAKLSFAIFDGSNLTRASFSNCNCSDASFTRARLIQSNFSNAIINNVNFYGTVRDDIIFDGVTCDECWIETDKKFNKKPESFSPDQFVWSYGSKQIKLIFGDFTYVNLVSFPYYVKKIIEEYGSNEIVFESLSFKDYPALIFNIRRTSNITSLDICNTIESCMKECFTKFARNSNDSIDVQMKEDVMKAFNVKGNSGLIIAGNVNGNVIFSPNNSTENVEENTTQNLVQGLITVIETFNNVETSSKEQLKEIQDLLVEIKNDLISNDFEKANRNKTKFGQKLKEIGSSVLSAIIIDVIQKSLPVSDFLKGHL